MGDNEEWQIDIKQIEGGQTINLRVSVSGCNKGSGYIALYDEKGKSVEGIPVYNWSGNKRNLLDVVAILTCKVVWDKANEKPKNYI